jgi:hypothetical protein
MTSKSVNYRLKDGDQVVLLESTPVAGYWFCQDTMTRGCWEKMHLLAGCVGRVIRARTPCVTAKPGQPKCFANVDIDYMGNTHRVRVFHSALRRARNA